MASLETFPDQFSESMARRELRNSSKSNYPDEFLSSRSNRLSDDALEAWVLLLLLPWESLLPRPERDLAAAVQNL